MSDWSFQSRFPRLALVLMATAALFVAVGCSSQTGGDQAQQEQTQEQQQEKLKAGFIYVSPTGDFGYSHAHDRGRKKVVEKYDWLETVTAESVAPADVGSTIDSMVNDGAEVIFATSFGHMEPTAAKAEEYPDVKFYHASGSPIVYEGMMGEEFNVPNMGFYFADFYQIYYMNGLAAGAMSIKQDSDKVGYVAAHTTSEVNRHMNSFYMGAKEVNPDVKMRVVETGAWYDPSASQSAAETLIDWGATAIAWTVDSPAAIQAAQSHFEETGERVYSFSHYTPMKDQGPDVVLSGQLVHWEKLYTDLLSKAYAGTVEPYQHWCMIHEGCVEMGSTWGEPINPEFTDDLKNVTVNDNVLGEVNVHELIMHRQQQFAQLRHTFHPFTGPIKDHEGTLRLKQGEVMHQDDLRFGFDWWPEGVMPPE